MKVFVMNIDFQMFKQLLETYYENKRFNIDSKFVVKYVYIIQKFRQLKNQKIKTEYKSRKTKQ